MILYVFSVNKIIINELRRSEIHLYFEKESRKAE